jgi:hypothetical protein
MRIVMRWRRRTTRWYLGTLDECLTLVRVLSPVFDWLSVCLQLALGTARLLNSYFSFHLPVVIVNNDPLQALNRAVSVAATTAVLHNRPGNRQVPSVLTGH